MPSTARTYRIATIPGDGVGSEVAYAVRAAIDATTAAGTLTKDLGGSATTEGVTSALVAALLSEREVAVR